MRLTTAILAVISASLIHEGYASVLTDAECLEEWDTLGGSWNGVVPSGAVPTGFSPGCITDFPWFPSHGIGIPITDEGPWSLDKCMTQWSLWGGSWALPVGEIPCLEGRPPAFIPIGPNPIQSIGGKLTTFPSKCAHQFPIFPGYNCM